MKRTISFAICLLLLATLIGCSSGQPETTTTLAAGTTPAEVTDAELAISDIDAINQDLDLKDLENVDDEIDSINW
jgi:hypothetical protein